MIVRGGAYFAGFSIAIGLAQWARHSETGMTAFLLLCSHTAVFLITWRFLMGHWPGDGHLVDANGRYLRPNLLQKLSRWWKERRHRGS